MRDDDPGHEAGEAGGTQRRPAGALEAEVLAVLRGAGAPQTPGDVRERLPAREQGALSYSTVVTILSRLYAKGQLSRERAGRGFAYSLVDDASLAAGRMTRALDAGPDRDAVLSRFVSSLSGRDARLLRELLAGGEDRGQDRG